MVSFTSILASFLVVSGVAIAKPTPKVAPQPVVTYLGSQGSLLSGGAWTNKGIVFTSGTVPSFNGSIVAGGIEAQTAQVLKNIEVVLLEAGTSLDYVLKTTVFLANMSDYTAMNAVYSSMFKTMPKPARTAVEVGKLPGNFLVEIEAIAAIPDA
ncbi:Endoribonuclease L-PSP/chorismate mutase-like protein [Dendryphion nanum]|uniref:Endoribonuclease L-PSP/chorismate mutase-like protein n=1 Tax=Dendryphion nanum TaxID=256645 RepID=A0A9P9I7H3_9PLEO|nr:Endoribonuclease L-PSP/chorismate mutase-like protein [Dendryphion nanum]